VAFGWESARTVGAIVDQDVGSRSAGLTARRAASAPVVSEAHLKLLLDSVQDCGIVMVSHNGMILTWNSAAEAINGYASGEVIGQHLSVLYPPEDVARRLPELELELARTCGTHRSEGWRLRKDGGRVWVSHQVTPLHDRTGRLRGYGTATRVLSDRMRAQDLLAVLDAVPDAVLGIDGDGKILLANVAAERVFGAPDSGLLGRPVETLLPERFRSRHVQRRLDYVADTRQHPMTARPPVRGLRADGSEFPAEVRLSSVQTPRGPIVTALVCDLSEVPTPRTGSRVQAARPFGPGPRSRVAVLTGLRLPADPTSPSG
jgi:PAS domain S-box-containing protein